MRLKHPPSLRAIGDQKRYTNKLPATRYPHKKAQAQERQKKKFKEHVVKLSFTDWLDIVPLRTISLLVLLRNVQRTLISRHVGVVVVSFICTGKSLDAWLCALHSLDPTTLEHVERSSFIGHPTHTHTMTTIMSLPALCKFHSSHKEHKEGKARSPTAASNTT